MSLVELLGYVLYGKAMSFAEELPVYASKVRQTIEPISKKIQNFQQSAGNLANDVHATKKVPEVRLQQSPTWPAYLVRGVGSVWGALIIAGVVPFLAFFMLCTKDQMAIRMDGLFGSRIEAARFITNLNQMIRGFVAGNLVVGSVMAMATTLVLWSLGMKGAIPLGIASGLLKYRKIKISCSRVRCIIVAGRVVPSFGRSEEVSRSPDLSEGAEHWSGRGEDGTRNLVSAIVCGCGGDVMEYLAGVCSARRLRR
jgi:hypothetical protein